MKSFVSLLFYLGFGMLMHLVFVGDHLNLASAWTWAWLLAWPFLLIYNFFLWLIVATAAVAVLIVALLVFCEVREDWRWKRHIKKAKAMSRDLN